MTLGTGPRARGEANVVSEPILRARLPEDRAVPPLIRVVCRAGSRTRARVRLAASAAFAVALFHATSSLAVGTWAVVPSPNPSGGGFNALDAVAIVLSTRDLEVASLVARGLSNTEIAARLIIAERTVDTHLHHILTRLGFTSRVQLATWHAEQASSVSE
jgi:DNA-binding CsgD family transcriptional regulator